MLHDVGKIGVPDSIITKEGKLNDEEYATIRLDGETENINVRKIKTDISDNGTFDPNDLEIHNREGIAYDIFGVRVRDHLLIRIKTRYRTIETTVVRLDGEDWDSNDYADNENSTVKNDDFGSWDTWKERNRAGLDWDVLIKRDGNKVTVSSENAGINIKFTSVIKHDPPDVFLALTGDQVVITNIKIRKTE